MGINKNDREQRIKDLMEHSGFSRSEAEFAIAVEDGEIEGDVIITDQSGQGNGDPKSK